MLKKRLMLVLSLLILASMILAACTPAQTATEPPAATGAPTEATEAPTEAPTAAPTEAAPQVGAYVDSVTFTNQNDYNAGVTQLQAGDIQMYGHGIGDADTFKTVKSDPNLTYSTASGSTDDLTFNNSVCTDTTKLNPFSNPKLREAVNWLVDRDYISTEIFGGLAVPMYTTLIPSFADYARYIDLIAPLEAKYAYNTDKAKQVFTDELTTMGATVGSDGKFQFNGQPLTISVLIRTEDKRKEIGDYVASQLEDIGFTVTRDYKTRSEASPIWNAGPQVDCQYNVYTGGWINTVISRDDAGNFGFYYSNLGGATPLWQSYVSTPEVYDVYNKLWTNDFASMDERRELFAKALPASMEESQRIFLVAQTTFTPYSNKITVSNDLAAGVDGSPLWPYTLRYLDQTGGDVQIAQPGILVEPWNPVAGSNWVYDQDVQNATNEYGVLADPFTGLYRPARVESAEVTVQTGLPVSKTLDWVSLDTADSITVPADAWGTWDAKAQTFTPVGDGVTSKVKVCVNYPADMFQKVKWHDGSPLTVGDFVAFIIMNFDPGSADSPIYDEALAPVLDAYLSHFKGVQIESTDPLRICTYDDQLYLDAETIVYYNTWFPKFIGAGGAEASWDMLALGYLADTDGKAAFSTDKATAKSVEWLSYVAGPSLDILKSALDEATTQNFIPYAPTMGQFVTTDEATARYKNMADWYAAHNHFWIGTGPFYLDSVHPVEATITVKKFADFPDDISKWSAFSTPKIATVDVSGPATVKIGDTATFDVAVTFNGAPYATSDLAAVKYLVFDATGALAATGDATAVSDGQYTVELGADVTSKLAAGSNKLEVVATSNLVSLPSFGTFQFVTAP